MGTKQMRQETGHKVKVLKTNDIYFPTTAILFTRLMFHYRFTAPLVIPHNKKGSGRMSNRYSTEV